MTPNLIDAVRARVSPDMIGAMSREVGLPPAETSATVRRSIPSILASMISSASNEAGAARLLDAATEAHESGLLDNLGRFGALEATDVGVPDRRMADAVFGNRDVAEVIAQAEGERKEVVSRILWMLMPIALAVVGKEAVSRRRGTVGFMEMLTSQKGEILSSPDLPRGLGPWLGIGAIATHRPAVAVAEPPQKRRAVANGGKRLPWGLLGLLAALVLLGLFYFGGRHGKPEATVYTPTVEAPEPPAVFAPLPAQPAKPTSETTVTGAVIEVPNLEAYKFNFHFDTTELTGDGGPSLDKLAAALKANPDARIRLVGYTDGKGGDDYNEQLGTNRAKRVKEELVQRGVDGPRIEIAGPGKERPIANNATDEGRAENRRVEVMLLPLEK